MTGTRWARKNLQVLVSACVSLATISLSAKEPEFSRNRDLPPLTLKAADLDTILQRLIHLLPRRTVLQASKILFERA
jgi:5-methylcytosine-specific restriction endonuclease McrA